jgi:DNA repair photolyase
VDHVQHTVTLKTVNKDHKADLEKAAEAVEKHINEHHNIKGALVPWWNFKVGDDEKEFDWEHQRKIEKSYHSYIKGKKQPDPEITYVHGKITYKFQFEDNEHGNLTNTNKSQRGVNPLKCERKVIEHSKVDDRLPQDVLADDA